MLLQRLGDAWRTAAWLLLCASAAAVVFHLTVGRLDPAWLWLTALGVYSCATVIALVRRPDRGAAAYWADRHLGGCSAYTASLEFLEPRAPNQDGATLNHLRRWCAARIPESEARLRTNPVRWLPGRTIAAACLALVIATIAGQLFDPDPQPRPGPRAATDPPTAVVPEATEAASRLARALAAPGLTGGSRPEPDGSRPAEEGTSTPGDPSSAFDTPDRAIRAEASGDDGAAGTGQWLGGGGNVAGRALARAEPDAVSGGEAAVPARLLDTDLDRASARAASDAAVGTYVGTAGQPAALGATGPVRPAAARLPDAAIAQLNGPLEAELVRRYFEARGGGQ
jgi:hypothetical protein